MAGPGRSAGRAGLILLVAAALAGVFAYLLWALRASWRLGGDSELGLHGWIALGLAFVVTGLLGAGLKGLAFYSSRRGYDDQAGRDED